MFFVLLIGLVLLDSFIDTHGREGWQQILIIFYVLCVRAVISEELGVQEEAFRLRLRAFFDRCGASRDIERNAACGISSTTPHSSFLTPAPVLHTVPDTENGLLLQPIYSSSFLRDLVIRLTWAPISYSSTIGTPRATWETTSGGVRMAAITKMPRITYLRLDASI